MKLEEIIAQSLSLADHYGLEASAGQKKRRAEAFRPEDRCEDAEACELVGAEK